MFDLMALWCNLNILLILLTIISPKDISVGIDAANSNGSVNFTVIKFLKDLQDLHNCDTILLMHNRNATIATIFYANVATEADDTDNATSAERLLSGIADDTPALQFAGHLMQQIEVPVLQLNEWQTFYLKPQLTEYVLAVLQIDINSEGIQETLDQHRELLQKMRQNLQHMTMVKVVLLINYPEEMDETDSELVKGCVEKLLRDCWQQRLIYVIAILGNYKTSRIIYRFNPFPTFQMETLTIAMDPREQDEVYPNRLANLKGYKMPLIIGGTEPRIIPYTTSDGKLFVGGFVGHYILAFAKRYNCTLYQPIPYNPVKAIPSQDLLKAVVNGIVEWSAAITFPLIPFRGYSYPYEQLNWCIMIPLEPDVPGYKFFTSVFKGETYILVICSLVVISMVLSAALYIHGYRPDVLDVICHDDCLRGILGQSFSEIANPPKIVRALYLEICILGMLLTTTYNAYFSTYVTKAPKETILSTFDDVLASGLKVVAYEQEYNEVLGRIADLRKYTPLFVLEPSFQKYVDRRDSFNTKFGYVVPTTKWTIVNEQQKIFTTPLFKQTHGFCFFNSIPMCFPIQENSVFNALLYKLILEIYQSGLLYYWREYGFLELIKANKLALSDLSPKKKFEAMQVGDLQYIFIFLAIMLLAVIMVFVGELFVFYRRKIYGKLLNFTERLGWERKRRTMNPIITSREVFPHSNRMNDIRSFN